MKILFNPIDGEIFYAVKESDFPFFTHSTNIDLSVGELSETDETLRQIRSDLYLTVGRKDAQGQGKYYVEKGEIIEREKWEEKEIGV